MSAETAPADALDVAARVAKAIEVAEGRYFIGGSLASSLQGEPRSTNDIDIVLDLPLGRCRAFVEALGPDFEADEALVRHAVASASTCNVFYLPLVTKIDLFGLGTSPFDESEFARRRQTVIRATGEKLWFKSPEDTVLRKLLWFREGGSVSTKQWRDLVQVLRISGAQMDDDYLTTWARRLSLRELLEKARSEASV